MLKELIFGWRIFMWLLYFLYSFCTLYIHYPQWITSVRKQYFLKEWSWEEIFLGGIYRDVWFNDYCNQKSVAQYIKMIELTIVRGKYTLLMLLFSSPPLPVSIYFLWLSLSSQFGGLCPFGQSHYCGKPRNPDFSKLAPPPKTLLYSQTFKGGVLELPRHCPPALTVFLPLFSGEEGHPVLPGRIVL